jgi:hypothetical protein
MTTSTLKKTIQEGLGSGIVVNFDRHKFLRKLKIERRKTELKNEKENN